MLSAVLTPPPGANYRVKLLDHSMGGKCNQTLMKKTVVRREGEFRSAWFRWRASGEMETLTTF